MTEPAEGPPHPVARDSVSPGKVDDESPLRSALSVLTTLGPPLTIATALMIYFGWARSDTQAREMGVDVSLFGFSTQDYVLQSISTLFVPLLGIAALTLASLALHHRVNRALHHPESRRALRAAGRAALVAGVVLVAIAVRIATVAPGAAELVIPLVLAGGTIVAAYGGWLTGAASDSDETSVMPPWQRALRTLLVGSVVTLALFWEVSNFASVVGRGYAQQIATTVVTLPRVTAFSVNPLGIEAPGVTEQPIPGATGTTGFRYRTTGLRLLVNSGGRMFFLHDGWKPRGGTIIVLPDNDQIRWQFSR